jgi:hypothetical protein
MTLILTDNQPRDLGYIEIDHRSTPAPLPPGVQRYFEGHTYTCSHCQAVVILNPARTRERYKCSGCNHHICDACAARKFSGEPCKTFAQTVDETLERSHRGTL